MEAIEPKCKLRDNAPGDKQKASWKECITSGRVENKNQDDFIRDLNPTVFTVMI